MQEQVNELRKRAGECLDAYLAKYYKNGRFEKADFWDNAEILEMLDDAYENTRDERYSQLIEQTYSAFIEDRGSLWSDNEFNDDIMWAVIAMTRAYMLTGKRKYFETDDLPGRPWRIHDLTSQRNASERPNSYFSMVDPKTGKEYPCNI